MCLWTQAKRLCRKVVTKPRSLDLGVISELVFVDPEKRLFPTPIVKYEKEATDQMVWLPFLYTVDYGAHSGSSYETCTQPTRNSNPLLRW